MRGGWTAEEDASLTLLMQSTPVPSWKEMSELYLTDRTPSQCRHRWHDTLKLKGAGGAGSANASPVTRKLSRSKSMSEVMDEESESTVGVQNVGQKNRPTIPRRTQNFYNNPHAHAQSAFPPPRIQHDLFYSSGSSNSLPSNNDTSNPPSSDTSSFTLSSPRARPLSQPSRPCQPSTPRRIALTPSNARLALSSSPSSSDVEMMDGGRKQRHAGMETLELLARMAESPKRGRGRAVRLLVMEDVGDEGKENEEMLGVKRGLLFQSPKRRKVE